MKRIALLTVLLLVVSLAAFAIDVKPTYTLTGSASVTFGYDLDTGYTGFHNTADASFTLNLLAADGTDTHQGTGGAYGSITINNIEFYWTDSNGVTAPPGGTASTLDAGFGPDPLDGASVDVTAKIVVTPFEIGVYAAPAYTQDFFGAFEDADVPDLVVDASETAFPMLGAGFTHTLYGTWVTATFGPAAVTVKVASNGDWTTNSSNEYAEGVEATLTFTPVVVNAGGYFGLNGMSFYGKGTLTMTDAVTLWAAAEYNMPTTGTASLGAGAGATLTLAKDTTLAATAWYGDVYNGLDLNVVFTEPGDAGLIPMLDTTITFNLLDVGGNLTSEYELVTATGYKIGLNSDNSQYARPFVNFTYGSATNNSTVNFTAIPVMNATVGVQLQIIPLTLFTAEWVSGAALGADLASNPAVMGSIQFIAAITY
jgi:hypothetical protein